MPISSDLLRFAAASVVTLLVVVDPVGLAPVFVALTETYSADARKSILRRALTIALVVALVFLLAGQLLLARLGVSVNAFSISGGILLFATAMPMLVGHRGALQSPEPAEEGNGASDIAIFPLAMPLISGPGTLTSVLTLSAEAWGSLPRLTALVTALLAVFALTWVACRAGEVILARIGKSGIHVLTRVLGILLCALAVQFVLTGITGYVRTLR